MHSSRLSSIHYTKSVSPEAIRTCNVLLVLQGRNTWLFCPWHDRWQWWVPHQSSKPSSSRVHHLLSDLCKGLLSCFFVIFVSFSLTNWPHLPCEYVDPEDLANLMIKTVFACVTVGRFNYENCVPCNLQLHWQCRLVYRRHFLWWEIASQDISQDQRRITTWSTSR